MYEKLEKICCDHWRARTTDDLLSSNVFCTEGRFFTETIYGITFYGTVCGSECYVLLMLFKYLNKKKEEQQVAGEIKNVIFDVGKVLVDMTGSLIWTVLDLLLKKENELRMRLF